MIGNRYSQHSFAQIPDVKIPRSSFDRSYTIKDTFDFDYLIPIYLDEIIPGDTHNMTLNCFARLATQQVPIMDNMYIDFFFFFVPNRLVWENWERFNGAQDDPTDTVDYSLPVLTPGSAFAVDSIFDKYGLPTDVANVVITNTLPLRAYIKIYNDWFRDQNLQNSVVLPIDDGPDVQADFALKKRGKRHDYFTSCLPEPQKGDAVSLPIGLTAPVGNMARNSSRSNQKTTYSTTDFALYGQYPLGSDINGDPTVNPSIGGTTNTFLNQYSVAANNSPDANKNPAFISSATAALWDGTNNVIMGMPFGALTADLSSATAATINQFRLAIMTQSLLELDARGGTRYVEILRSHFGVVSPDFRLQRAEYLGGGQVKINSHPVAQTSPTSGGEAQAQLAAFATAASSGSNIGFTKSFVEHGYVIGLACARADLTYQQGINRLWTRQTRFDFFWPKLQELGEQAVTYGEIYAQGTSADAGVFGYQERYAEYRYRPSEIHGQFRSTYATSLDIWHLAEEFSTKPQLNSTFIVQNTPVDRAIAVPSEPHLLFDCFFRLKSARPMLTYSVPATLGRF